MSLQLLRKSLSIVGGHFAEGHVAKGGAFLAAFALLPLITLFLTTLILSSNASRDQWLIASAVIYLLLLSALWAGSVRIMRLDASNTNLNERHHLRFTIYSYVGAILAWLLIAFGLTVCVIGPLLTSSQLSDRTLFAWTSHKEPTSAFGNPVLATGNGNIEIRGHVVGWQNEDPLKSKSIRLIFDGFVTPELGINANGDFTFRMPTGIWTFHGPVIASAPQARFRVEMSGPTNRDGRIEVGEDGQSQTLLMTVYVSMD